MKFIKLLAVGLLATVGFSSVVSATQITETKVETKFHIEEQIQVNSNAVKDSIALEESSHFYLDPSNGRYADMLIELNNDAEVDVEIYLTNQLFENQHWDTMRLDANNKTLLIPWFDDSDISNPTPTLIKVIYKVLDGNEANISFKVNQHN